MTHTEHYSDITVLIHTNGVTLNDFLRRKIDIMVRDTREIAPDIVRLELYLHESGTLRKAQRSIAANINLPGISLHASDSGHQWKLLFKHVGKRLIRLIEKRKELRKKLEKENPLLIGRQLVA